MQPNFNATAFRRRLVRWFGRAARPLPWRGTRDPYAILVSEMMLQQTQVATVLDYYTRWMRRFPDIGTLAAADESDVLHAWQGLGYYSRARTLHRAAQLVCESHGGIFPRDLEAIRALPGLGRYTAGAVATFAYDRSTPIVDSNIARALARIFDIRLPIDSTAGSRAIWDAAGALQPRTGASRFNAALMELGALVCSPRKPQCAICPVKPHCTSQDPESLPLKKPRRATVRLTQRVGYVEEKGRILLTRETGTRWRGLWRLPSVLSAIGERPLLTRLRYPITHHQVTLEVVSAKNTEIEESETRWFSAEEISGTPMPSPHRRALSAVMAQR